MKAKEYADKILAGVGDSRDSEKLADFASLALYGMMQEALDLVKARKVTTDAATVSCFREQKQKWAAVVALIPELNVGMWETALLVAMPKIHEAMIQYAEWEEAQVRIRKIRTEKGY